MNQKSNSLLDSRVPAGFRYLEHTALSSCFGMCEMELAVEKIVTLAVNRGTWRVTFKREDFVGSPGEYASDGFEELITHGWIEPAEPRLFVDVGIDCEYVIVEDLVKRLKEKRPMYWEEL